MRAALFVAVGLMSGVTAWGCGGRRSDPAEGAPVPVSTRAGADNGRTLRNRIHPDLPEFSFTVIARSASGIPVMKIEVRRGAEARPVQVIEALELETPSSERAPGLEVADMNFDGYGDLRLPQSLPAGPNVPFLNWLFDAASGMFVHSAELDAITSPTFDAATRTIRSEWRDGAARYGTDLYEIVKGKPVLVRKERREYTEPGVYTRTVSQLVDGAWKEVERRVVRE